MNKIREFLSKIVFWLAVAIAVLIFIPVFLLIKLAVLISPESETKVKENGVKDIDILTAKIHSIIDELSAKAKTNEKV